MAFFLLLEVLDSKVSGDLRHWKREAGEDPVGEELDAGGLPGSGGGEGTQGPRQRVSTCVRLSPSTCGLLSPYALYQGPLGVK